MPQFIFLIFAIFSLQTLYGLDKKASSEDIAIYLKQLDDTFNQATTSIKTSVQNLSDRITILEKQVADALPEATADAIRKDILNKAKLALAGKQFWATSQLQVVYKGGVAALSSSTNAALGIMKEQSVRSMNDIVQKLIVDLQGITTSVEAAVHPFMVEILRKQNAQRIERQNQMRAFVQKTGSIVALLNKANEAARQLLVSSAATGIIATDRASIVIKNYADVIEKFVTAYTSLNLPINLDQSSHYVVIAVRSLMQFLLNDSALVMRKANSLYKDLLKSKGSKDPYYNLFYQLALRLQGDGSQSANVVNSKGYDGVLIEVAQKTFKDAGLAQKVIDEYMHKKIALCQRTFINVLLDFSIAMREPTPQHLQIGYQLYLMLFNTKKYTDSVIAEDIIKRINTYMAALLSNRAATVLASLTLDKDTKPLVAEIINAYQQVATYYALAGTTANEQQYKQLALYLSQAQQLCSQAEAMEQQNKIIEAITLYQQAYEQFARAGDAIDAQKMSAKKSTLAALDALQKGKKALSDFVLHRKAELIDYMRVVSTIPNNKIQYRPLISALKDVISSALTNYANAIMHYKEINTSTVTIERAVGVLKNIEQCLQEFLAGNSFVELNTLTGFHEAQVHYANALNFARKADELFDAKTLADLVVVYPSLLADNALQLLLGKTQSWNMQLLLQRHVATKYIGLAIDKEKADIALACNGYENARARIVFLAQPVIDFLTAKREQLATLTEQLDVLYKSTQSAEQKARLFTSQQWQANKNSIVYSSGAYQQWQDILKQYLSIIHMGNAQAVQDFVQATQVFAEQYKQFVPAEFYPTAQIALLYYGVYAALNFDGKQAKNIDEIARKVTENMLAFFKAAETEKVLINGPDFNKAFEAQARIAKWLSCFEHAMADQDYYNEQFQLDEKILKKSVDAIGDSVCNFSFANAAQTVTIPNANRILANLYQQRAQKSFIDKNYTQAYQDYMQAQNFYAQLGNHAVDVQKMKDNAESAYAWSVVAAYQQLVIPNEKDTQNIPTITIAGIAVPQQYQIYNYVQQIPSYMPLPIDLQKIAQSSDGQAMQQAQSVLLNYAYLLFVDGALKAKGIAFTDVFTQNFGIKANFAVDADLVPVINTILADGQLFLDNLKKRVQQNKSSLHLQARQVQDGTTYLLATTYQPMFAVQPLIQLPITQVPMPGFPTAYTHYYWVGKIADPTKDYIQYGPKQIKSIKDKVLADAMQLNIGKSYLVATHACQKKVDYVLNGGDIAALDTLINNQEKIQLQKAREQLVALRKIAKNDTQVVLKNYIEAYQVVDMYLKDAAITYCSLAGQQFIGNNKTIATNLNTVISDMYIQLAQIAQLFLVGSPQAYEYFRGSDDVFEGVLADVQKYYQLAYSLAPEKLDQLQQKIATAFTDAGDWLITNNKNYFASLRYYKIAIAALKATNNVDEKKVSPVAVKFLQAMVDGIMEKLIIYRNAALNSLTVTLSSGQLQTITFDVLIDKIAVCPSPNVDSKLCTIYEELRVALLDVLIYLQDCSSWATIFTMSKEQLKQQQATQQDSALDDEAHKLVAAYMQEHSLSFDTTANVNAFIKQEQANSLITNGFKQYFDTIAQSSDARQRKVAYAAVGQWANNLFLALSKLYIQNFLDTGAQTPDNVMQFADFINALAAERQNISAPAEQWLGS